MLVTPSGMVMLVSEVQRENARSPIVVMLSGIIYVEFVFPAGKQINSVLSLLNKTPLEEEYSVLLLSTVMLVSEVQPSNAFVYIHVTLFGMTMLVSEVQP